MLKKIIIALIIVLLVGGAVAGWAAVHQSHMRAALEALKDAKAELEADEHNRGEHKFKALDLVQKAIEETRMGIEFDEREHRY